MVEEAKMPIALLTSLDRRRTAPQSSAPTLPLELARNLGDRVADRSNQPHADTEIKSYASGSLTLSKVHVRKLCRSARMSTIELSTGPNESRCILQRWLFVHSVNMSALAEDSKLDARNNDYNSNAMQLDQQLKMLTDEILSGFTSLHHSDLGISKRKQKQSSAWKKSVFEEETNEEEEEDEVEEKEEDKTTAVGFVPSRIALSMGMKVNGIRRARLHGIRRNKHKLKKGDAVTENLSTSGPLPHILKASCPVLKFNRKGIVRFLRVVNVTLKYSGNHVQELLETHCIQRDRRTFVTSLKKLVVRVKYSETPQHAVARVVSELFRNELLSTRLGTLESKLESATKLTNPEPRKFVDKNNVHGGQSYAAAMDTEVHVFDALLDLTFLLNRPRQGPRNINVQLTMGRAMSDQTPNKQDSGRGVVLVTSSGHVGVNLKTLPNLLADSWATSADSGPNSLQFHVSFKWVKRNNVLKNTSSFSGGAGEQVLRSNESWTAGDSAHGERLYQKNQAATTRTTSLKHNSRRKPFTWQFSLHRGTKNNKANNNISAQLSLNYDNEDKVTDNTDAKDESSAAHENSNEEEASLKDVEIYLTARPMSNLRSASEPTQESTTGGSSRSLDINESPSRSKLHDGWYERSASNKVLITTSHATDEAHEYSPPGHLLLDHVLAELVTSLQSVVNRLVCELTQEQQQQQQQQLQLQSQSPLIPGNPILMHSCNISSDAHAETTAMCTCRHTVMSVAPIFEEYATNWHMSFADLCQMLSELPGLILPRVLALQALGGALSMSSSASSCWCMGSKDIKVQLEYFVLSSMEAGDLRDALRARVRECIPPQYSPDERDMIMHLYPDSCSLKLSHLSGGFSGAKVLIASSVCWDGTVEPGSVVKIDRQDHLHVERKKMQVVKTFLGDHVPATLAYTSATSETADVSDYGIGALRMELCGTCWTQPTIMELDSQTNHHAVQLYTLRDIFFSEIEIHGRSHSLSAGAANGSVLNMGRNQDANANQQQQQPQQAFGHVGSILNTVFSEVMDAPSLRTTSNSNTGASDSLLPTVNLFLRYNLDELLVNQIRFCSPSMLASKVGLSSMGKRENHSDEIVHSVSVTSLPKSTDSGSPNSPNYAAKGMVGLTFTQLFPSSHSAEVKNEYLKRVERLRKGKRSVNGKPTTPTRNNNNNNNKNGHAYEPPATKTNRSSFFAEKDEDYGPFVHDFFKYFGDVMECLGGPRHNTLTQKHTCDRNTPRTPRDLQSASSPIVTPFRKSLPRRLSGKSGEDGRVPTTTVLSLSMDHLRTHHHHHPASNPASAFDELMNPSSDESDCNSVSSYADDEMPAELHDGITGAVEGEDTGENTDPHVRQLPAVAMMCPIYEVETETDGDNNSDAVNVTVVASGDDEKEQLKQLDFSLIGVANSWSSHSPNSLSSPSTEVAPNLSPIDTSQNDMLANGINATCSPIASAQNHRRLFPAVGRYATRVVHGDLNARNIIIDAEEGVWVIDWPSLTKHHALCDLAKLESAFLLEYTTLEDVGHHRWEASDYKQSVIMAMTLSSLQSLTLKADTLPTAEQLGLSGKFAFVWEMVCSLRQHASQYVGPAPATPRPPPSPQRAIHSTNSNNASNKSDNNSPRSLVLARASPSPIATTRKALSTTFRQRSASQSSTSSTSTGSKIKGMHTRLKLMFNRESSSGCQPNNDEASKTPVAENVTDVAAGEFDVPVRKALSAERQSSEPQRSKVEGKVQEAESTKQAPGGAGGGIAKDDGEWQRVSASQMNFAIISNSLRALRYRDTGPLQKRVALVTAILNAHALLLAVEEEMSREDLTRVNTASPSNKRERTHCRNLSAPSPCSSPHLQQHSPSSGGGGGGGTEAEWTYARAFSTHKLKRYSHTSFAQLLSVILEPLAKQQEQLMNFAQHISSDAEMGWVAVPRPATVAAAVASNVDGFKPLSPQLYLHHQLLYFRDVMRAHRVIKDPLSKGKGTQDILELEFNLEHYKDKAGVGEEDDGSSLDALLLSQLEASRRNEVETGTRCLFDTFARSPLDHAKVRLFAITSNPAQGKTTILKQLLVSAAYDAWGLNDALENMKDKVDGSNPLHGSSIKSSSSRLNSVDVGGVYHLNLKAISNRNMEMSCIEELCSESSVESGDESISLNAGMSGESLSHPLRHASLPGTNSSEVKIVGTSGGVVAISGVGCVGRVGTGVKSIDSATCDILPVPETHDSVGEKGKLIPKRKRRRSAPGLLERVATLIHAEHQYLHQEQQQQHSEPESLKVIVAESGNSNSINVNINSNTKNNNKNNNNKNKNKRNSSISKWMLPSMLKTRARGSSAAANLPSTMSLGTGLAFRRSSSDKPPDGIIHDHATTANSIAAENAASDAAVPDNFALTGTGSSEYASVPLAPLTAPYRARSETDPMRTSELREDGRFRIIPVLVPVDSFVRFLHKTNADLVKTPPFSHDGLQGSTTSASGNVEPWSSQTGPLLAFLANRYGVRSARYRMLRMAYDRGTLVICLDGLDEAGSVAMQRRLCNVITNTLAPSGCRVILTTRSGTALGNVFAPLFQSKNRHDQQRRSKSHWQRMKGERPVSRRGTAKLSHHVFEQVRICNLSHEMQMRVVEQKMRGHPTEDITAVKSLMTRDEYAGLVQSPMLIGVLINAFHDTSYRIKQLASSNKDIVANSLKMGQYLSHGDLVAERLSAAVVYEHGKRLMLAVADRHNFHREQLNRLDVSRTPSRDGGRNQEPEAVRRRWKHSTAAHARLLNEVIPPGALEDSPHLALVYGKDEPINSDVASAAAGAASAGQNGKLSDPEFERFFLRRLAFGLHVLRARNFGVEQCLCILPPSRKLLDLLNVFLKSCYEGHIPLVQYHGDGAHARLASDRSQSEDIRPATVKTTPIMRMKRWLTSSVDASARHRASSSSNSSKKRSKNSNKNSTSTSSENNNVVGGSTPLQARSFLKKKFSFVHLVWQEHLAAVYVTEHIRSLYAGVHAESLVTLRRGSYGDRTSMIRETVGKTSRSFMDDNSSSEAVGAAGHQALPKKGPRRTSLRWETFDAAMRVFLAQISRQSNCTSANTPSSSSSTSSSFSFAPSTAVNMSPPSAPSSPKTNRATLGAKFLSVHSPQNASDKGVAGAGATGSKKRRKTKSEIVKVQAAADIARLFADEWWKPVFEQVEQMLEVTLRLYLQGLHAKADESSS